jgi:signal transduction histidine kinase
MIEFLVINKVLIFLINAIALWLAFLICYNNPAAKKINRLFVLMTASMLLWVNFAYFARFVGETQPEKSLFFIKIAWFVTPLFFLFLSLLAVYIIKETKKYWFLNKIALFLGVTTAFVAGFTNLIIEGIKFENGNLIAIYGKGMLPFLAAVMFLMCATLYPLFRKYSKSLGIERKKIQYFLTGIFIFYLANVIFNIALPVKFNVSQYYYIGDYSTVFLLSFTAFAIVRHKLFGIKVVLTTFFVTLIGILLLLDIFVFTPELLPQLYKVLLLITFLYFGYLLIKSVSIEIERRKELEDLTLRLEKANTQLKKLDKAKSEFLSIASHQLRTPLAAIKGYISMILDGDYGKINPKIEKAVQNIYNSNERLVKLVNNLLNVSKIESGKIKMNYEKIQLEDVISETVSELKIKAEEKKLKINWHKPKSVLPFVIVDRSRIKQVFLNVIDNAIKYTRKGSISIKAKIQDEKYIIEISDTGRGVPKEDFHRLFDSFTRGEIGFLDHTEGAGLGLYIAKKFVEAHKGEISVESQGKNKGSTFYIELPIKK